MLGSRRALWRVPDFEPPLTGDPEDRLPMGRAALPGRHRHVSGCADPAAGSEATGPEVRRHATRRRSPHDGRSTSYAADESGSGAKRFAERSLRLVLEVLDGRRGAAQLRPLADPAIVAAIDTVARTCEADRRLGPAVLVALHAVTAGPGVVEIFGAYERGRRRFALAGRLVARRGEWRLTALRLR